MNLFSDSGGSAVGYLGPPGTFTHQATLSHPALTERPLVPMADAESIVAAVADGEVELGVVPWENSVAGMVGPTLDLLAKADSEVRIRNDMTIPVELCLWGRPGARLTELQIIGSHAHALAQCRGWMRRAVPAAASRETPSTAAALADVVRDSSGATAAVASPVAAAQRDELEVLHRSIADVPEAVTRFVILGRGYLRERADSRTILACFQPRNRPGSLLRILRAFADQGVDLRHVESRPTRTGLGHYYFLLECIGHPVHDPRLSSALAELATLDVRVRVLGVIPGRSPKKLVGSFS